MNLTEKSKFLALILRHKPEEIGITLDEHGWANVNELIEKSNGVFTTDTLDEIVDTDSKGRYSYNEDRTLIRANQGHSIPVDVELEKVIPPEQLYHGTATRFEDSINEKGLLPMSRLYVHLSNDYCTAVTVGERHGEPCIYVINAKKMYEDGYEFFLSKNGVYLTKEVPTKYFESVCDNFVELYEDSNEYHHMLCRCKKLNK